MGNIGLIRKQRAIYGAILLLFIGDRFIKYTVREGYGKEVTSIWKDVMVFQGEINPYIAFSLPVHGIWLTIVIVLIVLFLIFYLIRAFKEKQQCYVYSLLFLTGGAVSNLADRLMTGGVIDYIHIKYFTVFNIADVMILAGAISLFYIWLYKHPNFSSSHVQ